MYNYHHFHHFLGGYIKKEDASFVLRYRKYNAIIMSTAILLIYLILHFFVDPEIKTLYQEFGYKQPFYLRGSGWVTFISICLIFLVTSQDRAEAELAQKLKKYKKGEMILISKLIDYSTEWKIIGIAFLAIGLIVTSVILPIYSITGLV